VLLDFFSGPYRSVKLRDEEMENESGPLTAFLSVLYKLCTSSQVAGVPRGVMLMTPRF